MTSKNPPTIAVFDSGIGGLSILEAIGQRFPGARYVYGCDSKGFPYGTKTDQEVIDLVSDFIRELLARHQQIEILVIACNTASTVALEHLRSHLTKPIVGVVPALKPAAQMSRTATIGLLATPATINRPYTQKLIEEFARGRRVLRQGSSVLVSLAEAKLRGGWAPEMLSLVAQELVPLFDQSPRENFKKLDTVVLGCTHFPHLLEELKKTAPWPVQWIDSGQAIAARVGVLLDEGGYDLESLRTPGTSALSWYEPHREGNGSRPIPQMVYQLFGTVQS